jgi:hypothetical protein
VKGERCGTSTTPSDGRPIVGPDSSAQGRGEVVHRREVCDQIKQTPKNKNQVMTWFVCCVCAVCVCVGVCVCVWVVTGVGSVLSMVPVTSSGESQQGAGTVSHRGYSLGKG